MVLIQMMDSEKYIKEDINMIGTNYGRRKEDKEGGISMIPNWLDNVSDITLHTEYNK